MIGSLHSSSFRIGCRREKSADSSAGTERRGSRRAARPLQIMASQLLEKHVRTAAAAVVHGTAGGGQVVGRSEAKSTFLHEIVKGLRREAKQLDRSGGPGLRLCELHELQADALVLVVRIDADAGQFRLRSFRENVQRGAG